MMGYGGVGWGLAMGDHVEEVRERLAAPRRSPADEIVTRERSRPCLCLRGGGGWGGVEVAGYSYGQGTPGVVAVMREGVGGGRRRGSIWVTRGGGGSRESESLR